MNKHHDKDIEDDDDEDEFEDTKAIRKKRLNNKNKHDKRVDFEERRFKAVYTKRPRIKVVDYDPNYDEDDYDDYYTP